MPNFLILTAILSLPILFWGLNQAMSAPLPAGFPGITPKDHMELKQYPAYRSGTYLYEGNLSNATSFAFDPLFRHISSNQISMTAPVEARYPQAILTGTIASGKAKVSFLYQNPGITPQKLDANIIVEDHPAMLVLSLGVQGAYGFNSLAEHVAKLTTWLQQHPEYEIAGEPRELLYDSPFTPDPLKRREVQIPVRRR